MIPARIVTRIASTAWFAAPWSPYALLDADSLRICGLNLAFEHATGQHRDRLLDQPAFEAFPPNPDDPDTDLVGTVSRSIEQVLSTGQRRFMGLQRYDVPDPHRPGAFRFKIWMPVTEPITDDGHVVGVLHHAQDVTTDRGRASATAYDPSSMALAAGLLQREFPDVPVGTVLGLLTDSQRLVLDVVHTADTAKATDLARMRLEIQTERSALTVPVPEAGNDGGTRS